jgi:hypothetical protein
VQGRLGFGERGLHHGDLVAERGGLLLLLAGFGPGRLELADLLGLPVPLGAGAVISGDGGRMSGDNASAENLVGSRTRALPDQRRHRKAKLTFSLRPGGGCG